MPDNAAYYSQHGKKAALLSLFFPGLGQLHNKQYLKGTSIVSIFGFSVALFLLIISTSAQRGNAVLIITLAVLPFAVWAISIFDAYYSAVETRKRDAKRHNVEIITTIRGYDINHSGFEEITMTKNISRLGACVLMSREISQGSQLSLEFEGQPRVRARVVWAKETGKHDERMVGMELLTPLKQFA